MDSLSQTNYITGFQVLRDRIPAGSYIQNIPVLRDLEDLDFSCPVTFFTGENGSGKSTLLEAVAVAYGFNPEGGTKNFLFSTRDTHSDFSSALRLRKGVRKPQDGFFLRAESFYNVASQVDDYAAESIGRVNYLDYYGERSLHCQSLGESFLALMQNRFHGRSLFILDEPEAALSPQRQLTALLMIGRLARERSQFIIATHSPILLGLPGAQILCFDDGDIHPMAYEETEVYQVMEMFINSRQVLLDKLFSD
ncbi:MAG: AAA family ATPase [Clostridium sp.]|nr:AAA family ATPase [Clostridium sp.]